MWGVDYLEVLVITLRSQFSPLASDSFFSSVPLLRLSPPHYFPKV